MSQEVNRVRPDPEAIRAEVQRRLSDARYRHSLDVAETAVELARRFGVDEDKAYVAGLLHDVAKEYPKIRLLKEALDFGIVLTEIERSKAQLIHGPLGASIARTEFGVTDPDVLAAIYYHTTGRAGMSALESVVYVADYTEPGREFAGVELVRERARTSLHEAVLLTLSQKIIFLAERGRLIHPDSVAARNALLMDGYGAER